MLAATKLLSRQNCLSWQNIFVATKLLLRQIFVTANKCLSWRKFFGDKHTFVSQCVLSWQTCVCRDKSFVVINICCHKTFVTTKICLSWQKFCRDKHTFVVTKDMFCHDKYVFVATKLLSRQKWYSRQLPPMIVSRQCLFNFLASAFLCLQRLRFVDNVLRLCPHS